MLGMYFLDIGGPEIIPGMFLLRVELDGPEVTPST